MKKIGEIITKNKLIILITTLVLLIPACIGIYKTRINYDILIYLPEDIETVEGQGILADEYNMGSYSITIVDNMAAKDVLTLEDNIKNIDSVNNVVSLYDVLGTTIPIEMLPTEVKDKLYQDDTTLLFITFEESISNDKTLNAIQEIRDLTNSTTKVGGMSAMVLDTKNLSDKEVVAYVIIAVILCLIVLGISLDSYFVPIILLINIGIAILFNMGTNIFLGQISYITKAISSILQLGVTTDFSIFLYHKYEESKNKYKTKEEAMSVAIKETIVSVVGSSLTTMAGFLALCTMNLTLGKDIGIVMAKGVLFGVICVITIFPALLLYFDKLITKTKHKPFLPEFNHVKQFVTKHYIAIFVCFLLLLVPAWYGQANTKVYYNLDSSLPETLDFSIANRTLKEKYNIVSPQILLVDKNISSDDLNEMTNKIKELDGIEYVLNYNSISKLNIPKEMLDDDLSNIINNDKYQLLLVNSSFETATNELNEQISSINNIVKEYDENAIVAGEGPLMKDLVEISDQDFKNVTYASLIVILIIMIFVLKSVSLPIILICTIEFAIFINMGIPFYTNTTIPFIASIVIGTIQLGATIDYAILMTTKYLEERKKKDKYTAIKVALDNSVKSIFVSGLCFFAATIGVGIYTKLDMIGSICTLISRGAIISMLVVILILPSLLLIFDKIIIKTTKNMTKEKKKMKKAKIISTLIIISILVSPLNALALSKEETVYTKINNNGEYNYIKVNEHLINDTNEETINDISDLQDIENLNGEETYVYKDNNLTWDANGNDIYYSGTTTKELPISIKINYTLDGVEYNPTDIIGKSGNIKISINYTNNEIHTINGKTLYTPFVIGLTTLLNTKDNSNITITNGKAISNGSNYYIAAVASPGLYQSLGIEQLSTLNNITIKYDTTNFQTSSIYQVVTSKILDNEDLDIFNKLDSIYDETDKISEASNQLVNGSSDLLDGIKLYNEQYGLYIKNATLLKEANNKLNNSYEDIDNGIQEINEGINKLSKATSSINSLASGMNQIAKGINYLSQSTSSLDEELTNTINKINTHIQTLATIAQNTTDNNTKEELQNEIQDLVNYMNNSQLNTLKTSIDSINTNMQSINTNMQTLNNSTNYLNEALVSLKNGSNKLAVGSTTYKESLNKYTTNNNNLYEYTNKLYDGSKTIEDGTSKLNDGINEFKDQAIDKIINTINEKIKTKTTTIKELTKLSNNYNSYSKSDNKINTNTKQIILMDAIK